MGRIAPAKGTHPGEEAFPGMKTDAIRVCPRGSETPRNSLKMRGKNKT